MQVKIKSKQEIAKNTLMVEFDTLDNKYEFKTGQYMTVVLDLPEPDPRGNSRIFSIVNSPNEQGTLKMATRLTGSVFKNHLKSMDIGDRAEIDLIGGDFTLPENWGGEIVMIAGGIGITPFHSMINFAKETNYKNKIILIFSNRDSESAAFKNELEDLDKDWDNFRLILTMTEDSNWPGEKRKIDAKFIKDYIKDYKNVLFMVAGPPKMVDDIKNNLNKIGSKNIKVESFSGYL